VPARDLHAAGVDVRADGAPRALLEAIGLSGADRGLLSALAPAVADIRPEVFEQLRRDAAYRVYLERQAHQAEALRRDEAIRIPEGFAYASVAGLSAELRAKLEAARPLTLAQAARLEGMTPAAMVLLAARLRRAA
jgi:tRNA uridine 5-carboxymethylaminomethyl modification enzyme